MSAKIDRLTASTLNRFSGVRLDRLVDYRENSDWQQQQLQDHNTRLVPLWRSRCLVEKTSDNSYEAIYIHPSDLKHNNVIREPTLLGKKDDQVYFAVTVNDQQREQLLEQHKKGQFSDLRLLAADMHPLKAGILAYAKALHYWQHRHTFCGTCGAANSLRSGGHRMICSNAECGRQTFPRIDPAIIVLVSHGDACLLGRQASWPQNRFSTLAGFVEPGESLEDAVVREIWEEARVKLKTISYRSSQPWPFPAAAMAGFIAEATSRECEIGDNELETIRWFSSKELPQLLAKGEVYMPNRVSIAFQLVSEWYLGQTGDILSQLIHELQPARAPGRIKNTC
ncbi:MAG: NAD(+) diphosphatase [Xanthomonadales bacterium]|nr:NAD(+) diphosphatase [Xanthomonadales bacterium]